MEPGSTTPPNVTIQANYEVQQTTESTINSTTIPIWTTTFPIPRGCPLEYDWCFNTPIITLYQLIIGFFLIVFGYTIANLMSFTIYSKMLGPWPQVIIYIFSNLKTTNVYSHIKGYYDGCSNGCRQFSTSIRSSCSVNVIW